MSFIKTVLLWLQAREFHAQDLPSDSPDTLPPKQTRPPTQPEPFHLEANERGQKYKEQFKAKVGWFLRDS